MLERIAESAPALTWLLQHQFVPDDCCDYDACPFATPEPDPHNPAWGYSGDASERYFICSLLDRKHVWGEDSPCTNEQWRDRAVVELEALLDNTESSVEG